MDAFLTQRNETRRTGKRYCWARFWKTSAWDSFKYMHACVYSCQAFNSMMRLWPATGKKKEKFTWCNYNVFVVLLGDTTSIGIQSQDLLKEHCPKNI
jgi:hypothetical protein